jgi:hypothetical protein
MLVLQANPATLQMVARLGAAFTQLAQTGPGAANVAKVAGAVRQGLQENFTIEGAASGARWAPLAARTVKQRRKLGFAGAHMILVRTGGYRASFGQPGAPGHVSEFAASGGRWTWREGSEDYRAKWHELGTPKMPARPVTRAISTAAENRIQSTFDFILDAWGKTHGGQ